MRSTVSSGLVAALGASLIIGTPVVTAATSAADVCTNPQQVKILTYTDFHGRIDASGPDTSVFFASIEAARDDNTVVISSGDSIGASLFNSFATQDAPSIEIQNALELDASAIGNHEFDYGDFATRVRPTAEYPYVNADLTNADGSWVGDAPYIVKTLPNGVRVGIVGATTPTLTSVVSPDVMSGITLGDSVAQINKYAAQLSDGDEANDEADVIVATFHEGYQANTGISADVDVIANGHTHVPHNAVNGTQAVVQAESYASVYSNTVLSVGEQGVCEVTSNELVSPAVPDGMDRAAYIASAGDRAVEIDGIVTDAIADAQVIGNNPVATSEAAISRGVAADGSVGDRSVESAMSNMVAQMFKDQLGGDDPNFIGVQNPGGTRADLDQGTITYSEANSILPFANMLQTTQLTGAQLKTMLEQQWQRDDQGNVPSRPFLALGFSDNFTYTYDESRPEGDRITGVFVNGTPVDPAALYTIGSGSFLIGGGDNFRVIGEGLNRTDTGRGDMEAWVEWLKDQGTVSPDPTRRGVAVDSSVVKEFTVNDYEVTLELVPGAKDFKIDISELDLPVGQELAVSIDGELGRSFTRSSENTTTALLNVPDDLTAGVHTVAFHASSTASWSVGNDMVDPGVTDQTIDLSSLGIEPNTTVDVYVDGEFDQTVDVLESMATLTLDLSDHMLTDGAHMVALQAMPSGTVAYVPITVTRVVKTVDLTKPAGSGPADTAAPTTSATPAPADTAKPTTLPRTGVAA